MDDRERRDAKQDLMFGEAYPYDAPYDRLEHIPSPDWTHKAARGVLRNLLDRRGIKQDLKDIDEEIRKEIVRTLANIIRVAMENGND